MRVHVVYGNPVPDSLGATLHRTVLDGLARAGHEIDDLDLYAESFSPALSEAERRGYESSPANEASVAPYIARLRAAEALVFCFPTWWYAPPAIVKGYLDRVLLPGVAFHLPQGGGDIRPGLTHLRKLAGVVTYGQTRWRATLMGDYPRKIVRRYLRRNIGLSKPAPFLAHYAMNVSTPTTRSRFLAQVEAVMERF